MTAVPALRLDGAAAIGQTRIFERIVLEAPAGRWTCLLGPSGVGKSTILRLLAGIGDGVSLDGVAGACDGAPLKGRVALMAQGDPLLPWLDVRDNASLGARLRGERTNLERLRRVLTQVGLTEHAAKKPGALSGGQRQRVALARTLIEDRPVVLLDEPFSALDARTRARMQDLAAGLLAGRTVLHVTHDAAEAARLGHRILLMTADGLTDVPPPDAEPPRSIDAPETLSSQGLLLRRLLEAT